MKSDFNNVIDYFRNQYNTGCELKKTNFFQPIIKLLIF